MLTVYALKTCDTCRKARKWLDESGLSYVVRDVRDAPLNEDEILSLVQLLGWEKLLNKASTTWRGLTEDDKSDLSQDNAVSLLLAHPTLMKRPVFHSGDKAVIGFKPSQLDEIRALAD